LLAGICTCLVSYSQQLITIQGNIKDERSNPVRYASVYLLNSNFFAVTDTLGAFMIKNIPEGNYTVVASAIGYATINKTINLTHEGKTSFDFQLIDASKQLDEVIVTAEKKEENVQTIPSSISALNAKSINDYRLWNSKDITAIVPNLYSANPGDGRNVTSIRGITSSSYDPAVTTYIDGVNQFTLDTYIPQLFDVERIEVLRGPQGTLYGRNAMGGVINIITKQPTKRTNGFLEISAGNYGEQRYTGAVRTPIIKDKLFFGASLLYEGLNGYYTNEYDDSKFDKQHSFGGNYYLKYLANDKWSVTLNAKHLANRNYGSFTLAPNADAALADPFKVNQNAVAKLVDNTFNTSLTANYAGQSFNFSSQTSYQSNYRYYATPIDGDFSPADAITIINNYGNKWNNIKVVTEEFRFTSPASSASRLKWTAGSYLFYQNVPNKQATHFGKDAALVGSPDSNYAIINTAKAKSSGIALYAQSDYALRKKWDVILGIRYDYQYSKEKVLGEYQPDVSPVPVFETQPDTSANVSYSAFSPKLSVAYHSTSNVNLFASYSRGYRTGGLTQLGADPSQPPLFAYKPEYSNNFELGLKNTFAENRARANISFFYTTITDAQVPALVLPAAITVTKNAGSLTSKGVDAEFAATVLKGFEATYNFGYTDAKYTKLKLAQNGSETDLSGNRQIFTPDITSLLALQYNISLIPSKQLQVIIRGEWIYLGTQYFDLANTIRQSPYSLLNTRLGLKTKHAELYFWERNIANVKYIAYGYDFGAVHLGNPRTFGFTFKASM
ncbi:MAG TPA: TonB-dependent receptor, partial [Chitinophagaceae bacterium]|nr:TonB-dependent receptor [Chitinophagaceae bacterium]